MHQVILKNTSHDGKNLEAIYSPQQGMNLMSYKKDNIEVIDQSTYPLFVDRNAGLGAIIGPHFHRRNYQAFPKIIKENPIQKILELQGNDPKKDPFSHGIGRYASWKYENDTHSISAILKGSDLWNDLALKDLEGQDFIFKYYAELTPTGLEIKMSIVSESDSVIGIHHYYSLPQKKGIIFTKVQNFYLSKEGKKDIPSDWNFNQNTHELMYSLDKDTDFTFYPWSHVTEGVIVLDAIAYQLKTHFRSNNQECSWQLWHPKESTFVCIEPLSAQDPRHPNLTVSTLEINLEIL